MKALLQSEFAYVRSFCGVMLAIFAIVYVFFCWFLQSPMLAPVLCIMLPLSLVFAFLDFDANGSWERYRAALPFSRRDIVVGRYILILLSAVAAVAIAFVSGVAGNVVGSMVSAEFEEMPAFQFAATSICFAAVVLVFVACAQPFLVKFGSQKGSSLAILVFLLGFALIFAASSQVSDASTVCSVAGWIESNAGLALAGISAVGVLALAISCAISLRIYEHKDM